MTFALRTCLLLALASSAPAYSAEPLKFQLRGNGNLMNPSGASSAVGQKNTIQSKLDPPRDSSWYKTVTPGTFSSESSGFGATGKSTLTLRVDGNVITFQGSASVTSSAGEGQGRAVARLIFNIDAKAKGLTAIRVRYTCDANLVQTGNANVSTKLAVNGTDVCVRVDMGMKGPFAMAGWVKGPSGVVEVLARQGAASPSVDMEFGGLSGPRSAAQSGSSSGTITLTLEPVY